MQKYSELVKYFKPSHVVATVITVSIHVLLAVLLSLNLSGEQASSKLADDEMNLDINLEEFLAEDFEFNTKGIDPNASENKESESLSKENGKIQASPKPSSVISEILPPLPIINDIDTIVKVIEPLEIIEIEVAKIANLPDTLPLANRVVKNTQQNTSRQAGNTSSRFKTEQEKFEYYRINYKLIRNFRKVYPYALKTREIIENLNVQLESINSDSEKRRLIKDTEKILFKEYEGAVLEMSTSQGRLLLKLIARETNKTGFEIIKDFKGGFSASFWYGVGKIFGNDLKSEFHREKEDSLIEEVLNKHLINDLY